MSGVAVEPESLVGRIYEAAAIPELWNPVLHELALLGGGAGASIVTMRLDAMRWIATPEMDELIRAHEKLDIRQRNSRIPVVGSTLYPGFQSDLDILSQEQIDRDPFYQEFMRPRGYGWFLGTVIAPPGTDPIALAVERRYKDGPPDRPLVAAFDRLRPHLARAAMISAGLALDRARAAAETLKVLGLPAAVLNRRLRVSAANSLFEALIPGTLRDGTNRLVLTDVRADKLLEQALAELRGSTGGVRSIPMPGTEMRGALILHIVPIIGAANDIFSAAAALAVVTPVDPGRAPTTDLLAGLFDLSPAEARIAHFILEGDTLRKAAQRLGVSLETTRTQLKAVMAKTGTNRQVDLVRLFASLPQVRTGERA
jgi:DNA-binding CsgD family transcriptional regulator